MSHQQLKLIKIILAAAAVLCVAAVVGLPQSNAAFTKTTKNESNQFGALSVPSIVYDAEWWLDATAPANLYSDTGCSVPATTAGTEVKCWKNHNAPTKTLKPNGTGAGPTISASPFGGRRTVEFSGAGTIIGPDLFGGSLSDTQVFVVGRENVRAANYFFSLNGLNTANYGRFILHFPWNNGTYYWDTGDSATDRSSSPAPALGTPVVFNGWKDSVDGRSGHRVNGGTSRYSSANNPADTSGGLALGQNGRNDLAEVIVFGHRLTPAEEQAVENYLKEKWGIA